MFSAASDCGLWPTVGYGQLWVRADCGLWPVVGYGQLWVMASCGLWPIVGYGQLWVMATFTAVQLDRVCLRNVRSSLPEHTSRYFSAAQFPC